MACGSVVSFVRRVSVMVFTALLFLPTLAFAQSPWERAASNLERTFTGPLARSLALVAIVIAGNAAWTIASIALLFSGAVTPNLLGEVFVAAQAIVVGAFAELQYIGLRRSGDALAA